MHSSSFSPARAAIAVLILLGGTLIGIAGILALFHVHVPTVIAKILAPTSSQDLAKAREALAVAAKALEGPHPPA